MKNEIKRNLEELTKLEAIADKAEEEYTNDCMNEEKENAFDESPSKNRKRDCRYYEGMTNEEFFLAFRNELDSMIAGDILRISTVKEIFEENKKVGILILQNNNTYIDGLYILPEYRRKGLGRKAVADFVKENGLPEELHIIKKNYVARQFWESIFVLEIIDWNEIDELYRIKRIKTFNVLREEE